MEVQWMRRIQLEIYTFDMEIRRRTLVFYLWMFQGTYLFMKIWFGLTTLTNEVMYSYFQILDVMYDHLFKSSISI